MKRLTRCGLLVMQLTAATLTGTSLQAAGLPGRPDAGGSLGPPGRLRCEYLTDPLAVDAARPRFSWELTGTRRGAAQSAYRILVASTAQALERARQPEAPLEARGSLVWDSGRVLSTAPCQVAYGGLPLAPATGYYWTVRVWDERQRSTAWSPVARFTTGLLESGDWLAEWIGDVTPAPPVIPAHNGYHSELSSSADDEKWVVIDLGETRRFDSLRLWPARPHDWREDVPGFLFPVRFAVEISGQADFQAYQTVLDLTAEDQPAATTEPLELTIHAEGAGFVQARYVRLRVTRLAPREPGAFGMALAELEVLDSGRVISTGAAVRASDSIEHNDWSASRLTDGDHRSHPASGLEALPCPMMRKEFQLPGAVKRAVVYVAALGVYELHINGDRVGDQILAPEWTDYNRRVQYQAYDVTSRLRAGQPNTIGAILGDGWYAGRIGFLGPDRRAFYGRRPALLAQLHIQLQNGERRIIATDASWRSTLEGPVRSADILSGEEQDLRRRMAGWDQAGFDDSRWNPVERRTPGVLTRVAQPNEPIRVVEELSPVAITEPSEGVFVVDFGQNMVGWVRLRVPGRAGRMITVRHAEMLDPDSGRIYTTNLRSAQQTDRYILGSGVEVTLEPHFTYHGFRYAEITGLDRAPSHDEVTGRVFCSSAPRAGRFSCSNDLVNRLHANIIWTQRANLMGVPTDCPQRDERLGWMGDILAFSQTAIFNMDLAAFFTKWLRDVRDAQLDDGRYSDFSPQPFPDWTSYGVPGWADAGTVVPWRCYVNYADRRLVERHYDSARRWVDSVARRNPDHLWRHSRGNDYGDWLNGDTLIRAGWPRTGAELPKEVFATMMFAQSAELVARMARVLGNEVDAHRYSRMRHDIGQAFLDTYVDDEVRITGDTQAGYALALHLRLLPADLEPGGVDHLLAAIARRDVVQNRASGVGGRLSTGFHSTLPMMTELTRAGHAEVAYRLLTSRVFPSWGYTIDNGATTIWERWDGYVKGRGFQDPGMNSFNHYALGSVGEWFYRTILGISPDEERPGYAHIRIRPVPGGDIEWAEGSYRSIRGRIGIAWHLGDTTLTLSLEIPPGSTATLTVPTSDPSSVTEGGRAAAESPGVRVVGKPGPAGAKPPQGAVLELLSGHYQFTAPR